MPQLRWVNQASLYPHHCAVIPFKGTSNSPGGFIDTGIDLRGIDPHVYICAEAAVEIGKAIGWTPPTVRRGLESEVTSLKARIDQLEAELEDEKAVNSSIEFLGTKDFIARQKRGPKAKKKEEEVTSG